MTNPVVETRELTKSYGDFVALDGLTIHVDKGQILGFIGPNGAGKTTTIRILVGLLRPTRGTARIAGADCVTQARRIKRLVGYVPDVFGSYDNMRVSEYLDFFAATFGISRRQRRLRIPEVLEISGALHMQDLFVESLSHGMKQRVGIARTLLHDPEVLILDEPANGLDPTARVEMRQLMLQLADMGKTLVVTSHILPELSRICSVVAIITRGKLRAFGPLDDIMRQIAQRRTFEVQLVRDEDWEVARRVIGDALAGDGDGVGGSATERIVRFASDLPDARLAELLSQLIAAGVVVGQYRELPVDLEDAFLSVVRATEEPTDESTPITAADEP